MKLFIWTDEVSYTAFAHCASVAEAREFLKDEIGGYDGSCPERTKARLAVEESTPVIYNNRIAGFQLSDSAELREQEAHSYALSVQCDALRAELAEARERLAEVETRLNEVLTSSMAEHYELVEEKARLDWLEKDMPLSIIRYREKDMADYVVEVGDPRGQGPNLRAAIDAAMSEASL